MARQIITIPQSFVNRAIERRYFIDWRGQASSEANSGFSQVVYNRFPRWVAEFGLSLDRASSQAWRALIMAGQGRTSVFRLFMGDPIAFMRSEAAPASGLAGGSPFANGQRFSNGQGFNYAPFVTAAAAAAPGATEITVSAESAAFAPRVGQIISAADKPMAVTSVLDLGGGQYRLGVQLQRATIAEGDIIRLVATGLFELVDDMDGQPAYGRQRVTNPTITLREALRV